MIGQGGYKEVKGVKDVWKYGTIISSISLLYNYLCI